MWCSHQVIYLRKFKNLCSLDLAGNLICEAENYKIFVTAYLSDLVYLDYRLLDKQTVSGNSFKAYKNITTWILLDYFLLTRPG